jgi:hypothetical protein
MKFRYSSDRIRYAKLTAALQQPSDSPLKDYGEEELENAQDLTLVGASKFKNGDIEVRYMELWNENCLNSLFQKPEYSDLVKTPLKAIQKFFKDRFTKIAAEANLQITDYEIYPTEYHGEAILQVDMERLVKDDAIDELVAEADYATNTPRVDPRYRTNPERELHPQLDTQRQALPQGGTAAVPVRPEDKFNKVYMTQNKPQDPSVVDMLLKTVFDEKFTPKYSLSTDVGDWHPVKTLRTPEGKLMVQWNHDKTTKVQIKTTFFVQGSNKVNVEVTTPTGEALTNTDFEVYRIPTDQFLVERFFRKVYFSLMKKFINTQVIKQYPFVKSFVFWKSNNPYFSYSFSEPRKNQIILDLIGFIKTAKKPTLDDFFEQNNLRHKQGYLQTLLDASENAGIFKFERQGNEVLITKGANFRAFLEGRIRKY